MGEMRRKASGMFSAFQRGGCPGARRRRDYLTKRGRGGKNENYPGKKQKRQGTTLESCSRTRKKKVRAKITWEMAGVTPITNRGTNLHLDQKRRRLLNVVENDQQRLGTDSFFARYLGRAGLMHK